MKFTFPEKMIRISTDFINAVKKKVGEIGYEYINPYKQKGAEGINFLIFDPKIEKICFLKIIKEPITVYNEEILKKQEKKLSEIKHKNIIRLFDTGNMEYQGKKYRYGIFEFLENARTLFDYDSSKFKEKDKKIRLELAIGLVEGAKVLRENSYRHGDLHEGNILINTENILKIIDPGFSGTSREYNDIYWIKSHLKNYFIQDNVLKPEEFENLNQAHTINAILKILKGVILRDKSLKRV